VEAFVDANHVERIATIVDAKGNTYQAKRGGVVSTNRCLGRLKAFFNWAIDREYLTESPAQRVHKRREFERERRLEPGEEEKLRALTKDDWLWRLRIVAALETGCRIGEILNVQFKQLRWTSKSCTYQIGLPRDCVRSTCRSRRSSGPCSNCGATIPRASSHQRRTCSGTRSASA
jgi:integrase